MLREMPSALLSEWMAFYRLEPWGFSVDMWGFGLIAAKLHNIFKPKNKKALKVVDFIPKTEGEVQIEGPGSFFGALKTHLAKLGVVRRKKIKQ